MRQKTAIYSVGDSVDLLKVQVVSTNIVQSKDEVCGNIKHNRYFHSTSNFRLIHSHGKRLYGHMFDIKDIALSYRRTLIVCLFLQESSKVKESSLHTIWSADTAFLLCGADLCHTWVYSIKTFRVLWSKVCQMFPSFRRHGTGKSYYKPPD